MGFIITLILVGLVLIFAEILIIPGVGIAGILGLLSMGGSCYYAFVRMGETTGAIVTAINALLIVALTVWVLRAKTWKRLSLEAKVDSKAVAGCVLSLGDRGKTVTRLAPMGMAVFENNIVEVTALEGMIDPEKHIEVVMIEGNKVYVKPVTEDF